MCNRVLNLEAGYLRLRNEMKIIVIELGVNNGGDSGTV